MKKIVVGTVEGRHKMPVKNYAFKNVVYPNNFEWLEEHAYQFLKKQVRPYITSLPHKYQFSLISWPGGSRWSETDVELEVYTTGLSQALIAIINSARRLHIHSIAIYHYDTKKKKYLAQRMVY